MTTSFLSQNWLHGTTFAIQQKKVPIYATGQSWGAYEERVHRSVLHQLYTRFSAISCAVLVSCPSLDFSLCRFACDSLFFILHFWAHSESPFNAFIAITGSRCHAAARKLHYCFLLNEAPLVPIHTSLHSVTTIKSQFLHKSIPKSRFTITITKIIHIVNGSYSMKS